MIVATLRQRTPRALFTGAVFDQISHSVGLIFTPLYLGALGAGPALVGLVIGVTTFANPLIILSAGSLIERVSPRRLIVMTRVMVAAALLLAVVAQTWWQLAPALALISAGSLAYPAVSRAIAETTSPAGRARAFFLVYGVGSNLALILAPAMGGFVAEGFGLRWVYLVALLLELAAIACFLGIESSVGRHAQTVRQTYRDVVRCRPVLAISLFLFAAMLILTAGLALLPTFLYDYRGLSVGTIGRLGSLSGVGGLALALGLARIRRRVSVVSPLIVTLALIPGAFALLAFSPHLAIIAIACFISGAYLMVWPLVDAAVGNLAPERLRGRSFALSEVFGGSGIALGPMLAGVLYAQGPQLPLLFALAGTLLALLPVTLVLRRYLERAQAAIEQEDDAALREATP
ncbi:MAG TPA: MFS transporter [Thermomicrobiales bacterium]|nr:MFS transporter [Thermomicrobiales bacterium]